MCSYGDAAAVSRTVDSDLAAILKTEVCDSIIAPAYEPEALRILKTKKNGSFLIFKIDPNYKPGEIEKRELFGFTLEQARNSVAITADLFKNIVSANKNPDPDITDTLVVATLTLKYTQSNSICVGYQGQAIGIGAGQQSRIHCTRLACAKADKWFYQQHPKALGLVFKEGLKRTDKTNLVDQYLLWEELSEKELKGMLNGFKIKPDQLTSQEKVDWLKQFQGICLSSDALIPFRDNIDRASRSDIQLIAHTGGALRDDEVTKAANEYGMTMYHTGLRLFAH
jgi:AICAR transformylase/IMP cyclohydrolase PurH